MSKIYKAVQNSYRYNKADEAFTAPPLPVPTGFGLEDEMLGLYKVVEALLPHIKSKIIQFIGAREGEGTSTVVREFARVAANLVGKSVLLLDADRHQPCQDHFFDIRNKSGWLDALRNEGAPEAFHRVGQSNLFVSPGSNSAVSTPEIFSSKFHDICQTFRDAFDLVLIDSSPMVVSPDGLAIASKVDAIVLVVEAERTRWQAVKTMRDSITRVGGNILGVVLNKRRYYIPQSIYERL